MSGPSQTAVKTLFAESGNKCFYSPPAGVRAAQGTCDEDLTNPAWKQVNGEVAHIKGENPGSARYDRHQSDRGRQGYENLMLLCPKHHKLIDRLDPDSYPPEVLLEMKARHLLQSSKAWCTADDAERFASEAVAEAIRHALAQPPTPAPTPEPTPEPATQEPPPFPPKVIQSPSVAVHAAAQRAHRR